MTRIWPPGGFIEAQVLLLGVRRTGLLQTLGFQTAAVDSGEEALAHCQQTRPDAVLLDLRMDGLSGLETARLLRKQHGPDLRIVAVSASAYDLDRQACLSAGCDDFLPKPVEAEAMWQTLGAIRQQCAALLRLEGFVVGEAGRTCFAKASNCSGVRISVSTWLGKEALRRCSCAWRSACSSVRA